VLAGLGVPEPLGEAEVDYVDVVLLLANADEEVVGLDVSVQEVPRVDEFNALELPKIRMNGLVVTIWSASISTVLRENLRLQ